MKILAIETSCDDTGIAILEISPDDRRRLLANLVSSQIEIHAPWGGVVPSLAAREHQRNLLPLLMGALSESKLLKTSKSRIPIAKQIKKSKLKNLEKILEREPELAKQLIPFLEKYQKPPVDCLAVTAGPGLEPALWAGVNLTRALACFWQLPIIPANHIKGHLLAALVEKKSDKNYFPAIGLVVSGGHTQLVLINISSNNHLKYRVIGETRDDAAGEAFDKVAKMLGLGYPGGPIISQLAATQSLNHSITQSLNHFSFPRPMIKSDNFDFSFSGLKTAVLYALQKMTPAQIKRQTPAIAAEFQQAVIDVLSAKTLAAVKKHEAKTIVLAGGVAANSALRQELKNQAKKLKVKFLSPAPEFCSDNAAMIALAAKEDINRKTDWQKIKADANWRIG